MRYLLPLGGLNWVVALLILPEILYMGAELYTNTYIYIHTYTYTGGAPELFEPSESQMQVWKNVCCASTSVKLLGEAAHLFTVVSGHSWTTSLVFSSTRITDSLVIPSSLGTSLFLLFIFSWETKSVTLYLNPLYITHYKCSFNALIMTCNALYNAYCNTL